MRGCTWWQSSEKIPLGGNRPAQERSATVDLAGFAVIDSGATETVCSLPALEALMLARRETSGYDEQVQVTDEPPKRFKFGNGVHSYSASMFCDHKNWEV